jgi:predicted Zn-dependent protease
MADTQVIHDLRRRLRQDPSSLAFARLAEECRRAGRPQKAMELCLAGLASHPNYLSARVTLGRALLDLGELAEARTELEAVLAVAPDNLIARRALAEARQRNGDRLQSAAPLADPRRARALRTVAALEGWLAAIHVTRVDQHP